VTILLDYRPALRQRTGVGEYGHELAAALARTSGVSDRLLLFTSSWSDRPPQDLARDWPATDVIDRRLPVRILNTAWHRLEWPPVEWIARRSVDVALSLHPLLMPAHRAARVATIHDLDFLAHPERTRAEVRRDYPGLVRRHAARAALIVVNSRHTARAVERELDVPPGRLVVCRPGIPAWVRDAPPRPAEPRDGYVLFIGTLEPRKNVEGLLDAWARLLTDGASLPTLRIAGQVPPGAESLLERLARPPLATHVEHVGFVADDQRRALYDGAQLLVMPSHHEGFGLPVLEAMALGVPVVAARRGALPEVGGDAVRLVDPDDDADIAAGIRSVLSDARLRHDLRARGLARSAGFSWDDAAATLRAALESLPSPAPA
jgi:glycosyltransferase involved in cell wall biosynthesis